MGFLVVGGFHCCYGCKFSKTQLSMARFHDQTQYVFIMQSTSVWIMQYLHHCVCIPHTGQEHSRPELMAVTEDWKRRRTEARCHLKTMFNPRFGSVFRTEKSPTYFSLRLSAFANLYTAELDNLMNYSLDYTFIPRRTALPHEPDLNFDLDIRLTDPD